MKKKADGSTLKVIFLGGVGEIGKNMTALEYGDEIIVIDCGLTFPDGDMPGVDAVIPDYSYLQANKDKIKGVVLTHGHEDHIGALPYFLKDINVPVYGTKLTLALVDAKLRENDVNGNLNVIRAKSVITLGENFRVEFVKVCHSIAGSCALCITTPIGVVFHSGDFKVDYTPVDGNVIDLKRISEIGGKGVLLLLAESTNIERPGCSMSESKVGESLTHIFAENQERRIFIATFASNVHRLQQILDIAKRYKRKVAFAGRSMINIVEYAGRIGELKLDKANVIDIEQIGKEEDKNLCIITTGSQGEPSSALTRIASDDFPKVTIGFNDTVILSASPIPGNERMVYNVINNLYRKGAKVIYESLAEVHASGHACQEEIKLLHTLIKPKFFIPVHGERRHLQKHAELAVRLGTPSPNIVITDIGNVAEVSQNSIRIGDNVPSGCLLVDGLGVGDVGTTVLRDRKHLAEEGVIVCAVGVSAVSGEIYSVDITSRGFMYSKDESDKLIAESKEQVKKTLGAIDLKQVADWAIVKKQICKDLKNLFFKRTKRNPMILPVIMEN